MKMKRFLLKMSQEGKSLRSLGRLFQRVGSLWLTAVFPCVFVEILGMTRRPAGEDLRDLLGISKKHCLGDRLVPGHSVI